MMEVKQNEVTSSGNEIENKNHVELSFWEQWNELRKNIVWEFTTLHILWHIIAVYGYLTFPFSTHKLTTMWCMLK